MLTGNKSLKHSRIGFTIRHNCPTLLKTSLHFLIMGEGMAKRLNQLILFICILSCSSMYAMEASEEEQGYKDYMVLFENRDADDYQTLRTQFLEGETPSKDTLVRHFSHQLDERVLAAFVLIRELCRKNDGNEQVINLPISPPKKLLGALLKFGKPTSTDAFPDELFKRERNEPRSLPTLVAGEEAITAYQLALTNQHSKEFKPSSPPPHRDDRHGIAPWTPIPE